DTSSTSSSCMDCTRYGTPLAPGPGDVRQPQVDGGERGRVVEFAARQPLGRQLGQRGRPPRCLGWRGEAGVRPERLDRRSPLLGELAREERWLGGRPEQIVRAGDAGL